LQKLLRTELGDVRGARDDAKRHASKLSAECGEAKAELRRLREYYKVQVSELQIPPA
jgi:hypothetical protein